MSSIFDRLLVGGKKQCIWIVRYGTTKHPIMEEFDTDLDPNEGTEHAKCIAQRLFDDPQDAPAVIYTSPFIRCAHTAQLIALATPHHHHHQKTLAAPSSSTSKITTIVMPTVRVEQGLTEWLTPDLLLLKTMQEHNQHLPRSAEELAETYGTIDLSHESLVNPFVKRVHADQQQRKQQPALSQQPAQQDHTSSTPNADSHDGQHHSFETEQEFLQRCATTMNKLLELHGADGTNLAIVSHAPCNQALTLHLLQEAGNHPETLESNKPWPIALHPWPLGGITKFTRVVDVDASPTAASDAAAAAAGPTKYGPWTMEFYADTEHLPGKFKKGYKGWSLPCFQQQQQQHQVEEGASSPMGEDGNTSQSPKAPPHKSSLKATSSIL